MEIRPPDHPSFPQPEGDDAILWRYMDAQKFESMVQCSCLYIPSALDLGDILEGSAPTGVFDWWKLKIKAAESDEIRSILEHNSGFMTRMAKKLRDIHYYVTCWHMNQHENFLMWQSYTRTAESVAIRTTYSTLKQQLPDYANMGRVRYIDYEKDNFPSLNLFEYIMHKDLYYKSENEVRGVVSPPAAPELGKTHFEVNIYQKSDGSTSLVFAPPVDLTTLIKGIVLHPDATTEYAEKVQKICSANGLPSPEPSRRTRQPCI